MSRDRTRLRAMSKSMRTCGYSMPEIDRHVRSVLERKPHVVAELKRFIKIWRN